MPRSHHAAICDERSHAIYFGGGQQGQELPPGITLSIFAVGMPPPFRK